MGGFGLLCPQGNAWLYDTWEAHFYFKKNIELNFLNELSSCADQDLNCLKQGLNKALLQRLSSFTQPAVIQQIQTLVNELRITISKNQIIHNSFDQGFNEVYETGDCKVFQLGLYNLMGHSTELNPRFYQLTKRDQALALLHEALHGYFHRPFSDFYLNEAARQFIWFLLGSENFRELNKSVFQGMMIFGSSASIHYWKLKFRPRISEWN